MECNECCNWRCEELTYDELLERWENSIGGMISPGFIKRYKREAKIHGVELEDVRIGYKYCSKGILTRFYLDKGERGRKPPKAVKDCPMFSVSIKGVELSATSPIWSVCTREIHGPSEVKSIKFTPGLYENNAYMRIPVYGSVWPEVEKGDAECSICGEKVNRSITIRIEKSFCCNRHYLEWWARRYREEYRRLNK